MAARRQLIRDARGRFARAADLVPPPIAELVVLHDPLRHPTSLAPRYRLRVFDLCWPWRASQKEAMLDALASRNAWRDPDSKAIWLDCVANVQQDPPPARPVAVRRAVIPSEPPMAWFGLGRRRRRW